MNTKYIKCYPCGLNDNPWLGDKGTCQGWDQNTQKFKDANKDDYIICSDVGEASYNDLRGPEKLSDNYISRGCGTQDIVNTKTSLLQRLITPKKGSKLQKHLRVKDRNKQFNKEEKRERIKKNREINKEKREKKRAATKARGKKRRHRVAGRIRENWNRWGKWVFIGLISAVALGILIYIGGKYHWYGKIKDLFKKLYDKIKGIFTRSGGGVGGGVGAGGGGGAVDDDDDESVDLSFFDDDDE